MPAMSSNLSPIEQVLLRHVGRYRLTVAEAVAKRVLPSTHSLEHATGLLRRMVRDEWLGSSTLYGQKPCYWLTRQGAEHVATDRALSGRDTQTTLTFGPLSEPSKARSFGMLAFCCHGATQREPLLADELPDYGEGLARAGLPSSFYRDLAHPGRLGYAHIDLNGTGQWDRIVQKSARNAMRFLQRPGFQSLIDAERFEIALVTATVHKATRIESAWRELTHLRSIPLRVVVVPELVQLVAIPTRRFPQTSPSSTNANGSRSGSVAPLD